MESDKRPVKYPNKNANCCWYLVPSYFILQFLPGKIINMSSGMRDCGGDFAETKLKGSAVGLVEDLPIANLKPPQKAVRSGKNEIEQLAQSIREKGLLQPIVVRSKNRYFEIIAGNRRYNACKLLGWRKISCHIVELDDKSAFEVALVENIQRRSMDSIEEAEAYKRYVQEYGWGVAELAKKIGKSSSYISKRISMLELPEDVLVRVRSNEISSSIAEELLRLDDQKDQSQLARLIAMRHLSSRKTRNLIDQDGHLEDGEVAFGTDSLTEEERLARAFDKLIISLRLALSKFGSVIEDVEDNWVIRDVFMQHRNILHDQIDVLMKEKRNLARQPKSG